MVAIQTLDGGIVYIPSAGVLPAQPLGVQLPVPQIPSSSGQSSKENVPRPIVSTTPRLGAVVPGTNLKYGDQGSGYTVTKTGKLIKNKQPKVRSLPERQASNWLQAAQTELATHPKEGELPEWSAERVFAYVKYQHARAFSKHITTLVKSGADMTDGKNLVTAWRQANPVTNVGIRQDVIDIYEVLIDKSEPASFKTAGSGN
jgi:hypothetical protein